MKLRRHFSYANVMSTLAVFIALAGGSIAVAAVGRNTIGSPAVKNNSLKSADLKNKKGVKGKDVVDGSLTGADVGDDGLTGADINESTLSSIQATPSGAAGGDLTGDYPNPSIAANAVNGTKVSDNSLAGADIDESSLGQVPSAASATNADTAQTLNGVRVLPIKHRSGDVTDQTIFDAGGLQLRVTCAISDEELRARTTVAGGEITAISDDSDFADGSAAGVVHNADNDFNPGDDFDLQDTPTAADNRIFQLQYQGGDGSIVSAHLIAGRDLGSSNCIVSGYAVVIG